MEFSLLLFKQIISMVLMALSGYVLGKKGMVTLEQSRVLSSVCIYLVVPCCMINSFSSNQRDPSKLTNLAIGVVCAALIHLIYLGANWLLSRGERGLIPEEQASILYNNCGNLIMPIVQNLFGLESVLYTSPYLLVQNLLLWTHGQTLMGGDKKLTVRKVLTNPAVFGVIVGLLLFLTGIHLPGPLATAMESMGNCMGPLSMLVTGVVMANLDLRQAFQGVRIYFVTALRLVILPLLSLLVLVPAALIWPQEDTIAMLTIITLGAVGPSATAITQQAQLYHNPKVGYVSSINVLTTLACVVTIPLMTTLFLALS